MSKLPYKERWYTQQFHSEGMFTATILKWTGVSVQWRAVLYLGEAALMACPHRHRSEQTAKTCADQMLLREVRKSVAEGS